MLSGFTKVREDVQQTAFQAVTWPMCVSSSTDLDLQAKTLSHLKQVGTSMNRIASREVCSLRCSKLLWGRAVRVQC